MKTFDEAFVAVATSEQLIANLQSTKKLMFENKEWAQFIAEEAKTLILRATESSDYIDWLAYNSSALHVAFVVGMLVGMEMEKECDRNNKIQRALPL